MKIEHEELLEIVNNNLKTGFDLRDDQDGLTAVFNIRGEANLFDNVLIMKIILLNKSDKPFTISKLYLFEESTSIKTAFEIKNNNMYMMQNEAKKAELKFKLSDQTQFRKYHIGLEIVGYPFELSQEIYPNKIKSFA